jgi:hypothetical protein
MNSVLGLRKKYLSPAENSLPTEIATGAEAKSDQPHGFQGSIITHHRSYARASWRAKLGSKIGSASSEHRPKNFLMHTI